MCLRHMAGNFQWSVTWTGMWWSCLSERLSVLSVESICLFTWSVSGRYINCVMWWDCFHRGSSKCSDILLELERLKNMQQANFAKLRLTFLTLGIPTQVEVTLFWLWLYFITFNFKKIWWLLQMCHNLLLLQKLFHPYWENWSVLGGVKTDCLYIFKGDRLINLPN